MCRGIRAIFEDGHYYEYKYVDLITSILYLTIVEYKITKYNTTLINNLQSISYPIMNNYFIFHIFMMALK